MKKSILFALSAVLLASSSAFAQGVTRAEVKQQLVTAEQNGSGFVTDASYPDVSPVNVNQVAYLKKQAGNASVGGTAAGTYQSGSGAPVDNSCVGPRTYCDIYAGS